MNNIFLKILMMLMMVFSFSLISYSADEKDTATEIDKLKVEDKKVSELSEDSDIKKVEKVEDVEIKVEHKSYTPKVFQNGKDVFVNSRVKLDITATDNTLTDKTYYKLGEADEKLFAEPFFLVKEGYNKITYHSVDKVGNIEGNLEAAFIMDNTPPAVTVITDKPVIKSNGKFYISKEHRFIVKAVDSSSGLDFIEYSIDGENFKEYYGPFNIPSTELVSLKIRATDNVDNISDSFSFKAKIDDQDKKDKTSDDGADGADDEKEDPLLSNLAVAMDIDEKAPIVVIEKDNTIAKSEDGKEIILSTYKFKVTAEDGESGVKSILVRIDGIGEFVEYQDGIELSIYGKHKIEAIAIDRVGNVSDTTVHIVYPEKVFDTVPVKETSIEEGTK